MFAIPGICALMIFILARPQEFIPLLQRVPFLHLFTALAVLGWVIDVRLRRLQPLPVPTLPWVIAFLLWAFIGIAVVAPEKIIERGIELAILFALYGTLAHGVQKFRTFQIVAGTLVTTCLFIAFVCFHQGVSPKQCIAGEYRIGTIDGEPDGRVCETVENCMGPEAEPGKEYRCEHAGLFGTYSVEERVRYRGELQDPNEVALCISAGALSLLIAFALRRRNPLNVLLCAAGVTLVILTVLATKSRGGMVSAMLVPGVYLLRRYRIKGAIVAGSLAVAAIALGGRSGANADVSTQLRYEAWASGLDMFKENPIFGVGAGLFSDHHYLTAHNSLVLTLAELGLVGMMLYVTIIYLTFKTLYIGLTTLAVVPGTAAVRVWGMALMASMSGIVFQSNTLSFAYHSVLWIFLGLVGAWYSAIKHHKPDFEVKFGWRDVSGIVVGCLAFVFLILPVFLKYKGEY
ncbi:MAG: O-antigen ligase family protein [Deltaproteobacteria bacterium]|nr:O-antigen ligase family protein [Deltaproteobacteria bacterium]